MALLPPGLVPQLAARGVEQPSPITLASLWGSPSEQGSLKLSVFLLPVPPRVETAGTGHTPPACPGTQGLHGFIVSDYIFVLC